MTIDHAKFILQAYRSDQDPAGDPELEEALKLLEGNQELREWYENETAFDAAFSSKLAEIEVPKDLETQIQSQVIRKSNNLVEFPWWRQFSVLGAVAAIMLVLGLILLPSEQDSLQGNTMTVQAFQNFANQSLKRGNGFNARAEDWGTLVKYLSEHNTPAPSSLPGKIDEMPPVGCMTLKFKDKPVGVICFGKKSKSHLFVVNSEDFPQMPVESKPVMEQNPYTASVYWSGKDRHYLLVSHDPKELSQFVSF